MTCFEGPRPALWALAAALAAPAFGQAPVGLSDPARLVRDVFPSTPWAVTPYERAPPTFPQDDDWTLAGASVALALDVPAGLTLGACALDLRWDAPALAFDGFDANAALFGSGSVHLLPETGRLRVDLARLGDNATTGDHAVLGTLHLTLPAAATAEVWVQAVDCRAFDGTGGQTDVPVAPAARARVGALLGDVAARTGPAAFDATRGDGRVEFEDLQVFAQGFGALATPGTPLYSTYRLKLDVAVRPGETAATDGRLDFEDLQAFSLRFGLVAFPP